MEISLRDYQKATVERMVDLYEQNPQGRGKFVWATGTGKTVGFSAIAHEIRQKTGTNVLIIAHRDELLSQAAQKYRYIDPDAHIGKVGGGSQEWGHPVTVASIQTISRPQHLKNLKQFGFGLVIVDECHHCLETNEYGKVLRELPDAFKIGCTATDDRMDGKSNDNLFGESINTVSILNAIEQGFLTTIKAFAIKTGTQLDGMHTKDGDYQVKELAERIDTPKRNQKIVEGYIQHGDNRQAMAFTVDIAHAEHVAAAFNEAGITAVAVSGKTANRGAILKDFERGKYKILCNCQVFTEGYDSENYYDEDEDKYIFLSCAIMARPTKSRSLFAQCIGRILRLAPGKQDALILDATDNCLNHRLEPQSLATVVELEMFDGETVTEAKERIERKKREKRERKTKVSREQDIKIEITARLDWHQREDGMYLLEVGAEKHRVAIVADVDDYEQFTGTYTVWARLAPFYDAQMWAQDVDLGWAQNIAEKKARLLLSDAKNVKLVDRNAPWRRYPASEKQIETLRKFGVAIPEDEFEQPIITKGEAADILDPIFEKIKARKEGKKVAV